LSNGVIELIEGLSWGLVAVTAAADSINPCVFGVLIFLLGYMVTIFKDKKRMLIAGLIYVAAVYITYFLVGLGLFAFARESGLSVPFYYFAASVAIIAGLLEIKDYFWYGKGFSLQIIPGAAERIKKYTKYFTKVEKKHPWMSLGLAFLLGIFVVFVELPCTGAPYLVILGLISTGSLAEGIPLLLFYNLVFILPLFFIIGMVYFGKTSKTLEKWRKEHRGLMRLGIGLLLLALGAYMLWAVI
jgi:cytochrome c biogenesis protein CcdA